MSLFLKELPLALGAAVSPTVLTVGLLILSGKKRPLARAVAYAFGAAVPLLVVGVLGVLFLHSAVETNTGIRASPWVDVAFGVVLIGLGLRRISKRKTAQEKQGRRAGKLADAGPLPFVGVGAVMMLTNFTTLALYLPMVKDMARSGSPALERVVVLLILDVIVLAVAIVPPVLVALGGAPARRALDRLNGWVSRNSRAIGTVLFIVFGVYLLVRGFRGM